jgi:hypothetical protein
MTDLVSFLALLLAAALPQQTATSTTSPPPSSSSTTTYHSDVLHFDYAYNSSLVAAPSAGDDAIKAEKDKATGTQKTAIGCITLPLTAIDSSTGLRMVLIMRMDGVCLGATTPASGLGAVTSSALTESLARFGAPQMGTTVDYQVAGHSASNLSGSVKSEKYGVTFYASASCLLLGSDVVCWELLASDCAQLPEMMNYPVSFDGKGAEPLIPAKLAPVCK